MKDVFGYVMLLVVSSVVIFPLVIFNPFYTATFLKLYRLVISGVPNHTFLARLPFKGSKSSVKDLFSLFQLLVNAH